MVNLRGHVCPLPNIWTFIKQEKFDPTISKDKFVLWLNVRMESELPKFLKKSPNERNTKWLTYLWYLRTMAEALYQVAPWNQSPGLDITELLYSHWTLLLVLGAAGVEDTNKLGVGEISSTFSTEVICGSVVSSVLPSLVDNLSKCK